MKMDSETFERVKLAVGQYDTEDTRKAYRTGDFARSDRTQDVDMRYRWDLLWHCVGQGDLSYSIFGNLQDAHIDTALRRIVPSLDN